MRSRTALGLFVFLCLFAVSAAHAGSDTRTLTVRFQEQDLRVRQHLLSNESYDLIEVSDLSLTRIPGHPSLPVMGVQVYVPRGSRVKSVRMLSAEQTTLPGDYLILPGGQEIPYSAESVPEPAMPDERIYEQVEPYPASPVQLAGSGSIAGRKITGLRVYPVQYIPHERRAVLNEEVTFEIELENADSEPPVPRETAAVRKLRNEIVSNLVSNPEDIESDFPAAMGILDPGVAIEYLILCHENHQDEYQALVDWKTRKGVPAAMITVQDVYATYSGRDDQERLRNCIKDYYLNEGTAWVVMTLAAPKAAIRGCYCSVGGTVDAGIPCDLYFADMDGDWNQDNDARWGETVDDVDLYPDVFLGRLPANTGRQTLPIIDKILTYEGYYSVPTDYQLDMLFLAEYADASTDGAVAKNMIDNESVPPRFDPINKLYESDGTASWSAAMSKLNQGMNIINHDGHGNANLVSIGSSVLDSDDMETLTNAPRYSVFYTVACIPGNFGNHMGCFGRSFIQSENGGGFFVGNSRYGWYWPGNPGYGTGELYDREFFKSIFTRGMEQLGVIHADTKIQRIPYSGSNNTDRWTQFTCNLFGDPETPIMADTPEILAATHADSILAGNHMMTVSVSAVGSPVSQARVCLWKEDQIYLVDETDGSGDIVFEFTAIDSGDILITATKNGYLPYLSEMKVVDSSSGITDQDGLTRKLIVNVSPNPVMGPASIRFSLPAAAGAGSEARIDIYNASGRLVKTIPAAEDAGQAGHLTWNRRLDSGAEAPAGIYFLKLSHGMEAASAKFVLLR
jgi:hypothetical protein